jgi:hypothetical protein
VAAVNNQISMEIKLKKYYMTAVNNYRMSLTASKPRLQ